MVLQYRLLISFQRTQFPVSTESQKPRQKKGLYAVSLYVYVCTDRFLFYLFIYLFIFLEAESHCHPGWSAVAQSRLTAIFASGAQAILLPQPPE